MEHLISVCFRADKHRLNLGDSWVILGLYLGDSAVSPDRISRYASIWQVQLGSAKVVVQRNMFYK